jgi:hypothetical protein
VSRWEIALKWSGEAREWVRIVVTFLVALHLPQPKWIQKKGAKNDRSDSGDSSGRA